MAGECSLRESLPRGNLKFPTVAPSLNAVSTFHCRRSELQTCRDTTTMMSKTISPRSTRVGPGASRHSRHSRHLPVQRAGPSAAFPRRSQVVLKAFTPNDPHKSQTSAPFSTSKDLFQYDRRSRAREPVRKEVSNLTQQFVKVVYTTSVIAELIGAILKALLTQMVRIGVASIVTSALWLVPNVGAGLSSIFLLAFFHEKWR